MDILGSMGQMYMFFLLALLVMGSGFAAWGLIDHLHKKQGVTNISKKPTQQALAITKEKTEKIGGNNMKNNGWLKLAVFSLVGVFISIALMGFLSANNSYANNNSMQMGNSQMNGQSGMYGQQLNNGYNQYEPNGQINSQDQMQQMQNQLNQMQQQLNGNQNNYMNGYNQGQNNMNNMQQSQQNNMNNMQQSQQNNSSSSSGSSGMSMM